MQPLFYVVVTTPKTNEPNNTNYFGALIHVSQLLLSLGRKDSYDRHTRLLQSTILGKHLIASELQPFNGSGGICLQLSNSMNSDKDEYGVHEHEKDGIYSSRDTYCIYCTTTILAQEYCIFHLFYYGHGSVMLRYFGGLHSIKHPDITTSLFGRFPPKLPVPSILQNRRRKFLVYKSVHRRHIIKLT